MLSQRFLKLSSFFFLIFFFLAGLLQWVSLLYLLACWSVLLFDPVCCWTPLVYFSALYSSALWFSISLLRFWLCSSPEFDKHLYYHYLNSLQGDYLSSYHWCLFFFFWGFIFFFCLECISLFPHFAWLSVCFYVLGKAATSLSLEGVALCRSWSFLFNHALTLGCLSNLCDCLTAWFIFDIPPQLRVCQTCQCSKRRVLI